MFQGQLLQSESTAARRRVYFHLVDATDGMTPETGEASGQPQISTNGGSFANTSATLTSIGNGRYYVELTTGELGTLGNLQLRYKSAATAEAVASVQVVLNSPFVALASQSSVDTLAGYVDTEVAAIKAKTDNLPSDPADASDIAASFTTVNGTLTTIAGYLDTEVAAIKAKTDNLPSDPADASDIAASFSTVNSTLSTLSGYVDTEVAAIKAKTDLIPASPAATGDVPSAATIAAAVWAHVVEGAYTAKEYYRLMASALFGKLSGAATTTVAIRDTGDTTNRITATVDAYGNRSAVTLDPG